MTQGSIRTGRLCLLQKRTHDESAFVHAHSFLELETGCLHRRIERAMLTVIAAATETVPLCLRYSNMPSGSNAEQSDKEIAGEKQRDQMLK